MPLDQYGPIIQEASNEYGPQYGMDPVLLAQLARAHYMQEDPSGDPSIKGPPTKYGTAVGVPQLIPDTARRLGVVDRTNPNEAIPASIKLIAENYKAQNGDLDKTIGAYFGGPNPKKWGPKTHAYIENVKNHLDQITSSGNTYLPPVMPLAKPIAYAQNYTDDMDRRISEIDNLPQNAKMAVAPKSTPTPSATYTDDLDRRIAGIGETPPANQNKVLVTDPRTGEQSLVNPDTDYALEQQERMGNRPRLTPIDQGVGAKIGAGLEQGVKDINTSIDPLAQKLQNTFGKVTLGGVLPTTEEAHATNVASRNEFNRDYGNSVIANLARVGGEIIPTLPIMGAAGKIIGAGAGALGRAIPAAQPALDFLTGATAAQQGANPLVKIASGMTAGIPQGAATAAISSGASDQPIGDQLRQGAEVGGIVGGLVPAASMTLNALKNIGNGASSGTSGLIDKLAGSPIENLDLKEYVPGSKPTLAEAAGTKNPGVSALQRVISEANPADNGPTMAGDLKLREQANDEARRSHLDMITGTSEDLNNAYKARRVKAEELLKGSDGQASIWKAPDVTPADTRPVINKIDEILNGPDRGNTAVQRIMGEIKNKLVKSKQSINGGTADELETDPEYLYRSGIKSINQWLESNHPADELSQLAKAARPQVEEVKSVLNQSIKNSTPGYGNYLKAYTDLSKPINQMEVLQNLNLLSEKGDQGTPTLAKINNALDKITRAQNEPGWNEAKAITPDQLDALQNLQKDLQRKAGPDKAIKTFGSPTNQLGEIREKVKKAVGSGNSSILARVLGLSGPALATALDASGMPFGAALGAYAGERLGETGSKMLAKGSQKNTDRIVNLLLNPDLYSAAKVPPVGNAQPGAMGNMLSSIRQGIIPAAVNARMRMLPHITVHPSDKYLPVGQ